MRTATVILVVILACGAPSSMPDPDPIGAESARPSLRGNRLVAPRPEGPVLPVDVTVTSPVAPGDTATATVRAADGARCEIDVTYRSGPSEAQGLDPAIAGDDGVSWSWIVGINTTPGVWAVGVDCVGAIGSRATGRASLEVLPSGPGTLAPCCAGSAPPSPASR